MVPELFIFTLRAFSSTARISIGPSFWPSLRMQDVSLGGD